METSDPTLVIMAAGMGSRYGGLKQIESCGPSGEIVIDYSVYDALQAGFGKIVFIIRHDIEEPFRDVIDRNISKHAHVEYAFQELDNLPAGYSVPENRTKPWGTGQAVLACRDVVHEPFAVINADDFYGREAYLTLANHLHATDPASDEYSLVAYVLFNTLSVNGSVTRGVCEIKDNLLVQVTERKQIEPVNGGARYKEGDAWKPMAGDEPVSMNYWGFTPALFKHLEEKFPAFLDEARDNPKAEFLLPTLIDELIGSHRARVTALFSDAKWLGVTYPEDKETVAAGIQDLVDQGVYGADLWASHAAGGG